MSRSGFCRRGTIVVVGVAALVLAACEPITHPEGSVVEPPRGAVSLRDVSESGRYALVTASGPSTTVPGPGAWRLDRQDGTALALPRSGLAISRDGSRVLLTPNEVWSSGVVRTAPDGAILSEDLSFALFRDGDGVIKTWSAATGAVRSVEEGIPRPDGSGEAEPVAVSDDGMTAYFKINRVHRFVDLDAGTHFDDEDDSGSLDSFVAEEQWTLAAGGAVAVRLYQFWAGPYLQESWMELVDLASGTPIGPRYNNPTAEVIRKVVVERTGQVAWAFQELTALSNQGQCAGPPVPIPCTISASVAAVHRHGARRWDALRAPWVTSMQISPGGRFLALEQSQADPTTGPCPCDQRVYDWTTGTQEVLPRVAPFTDDMPRVVQIAGGGRIFASTYDGGWFEYAAVPAG